MKSSWPSRRNQQYDTTNRISISLANDIFYLGISAYFPPHQSSLIRFGTWKRALLEGGET